MVESDGKDSSIPFCCYSIQPAITSYNLKIEILKDLKLGKLENDCGVEIIIFFAW